jgi:four helix bundle protein
MPRAVPGAVAGVRNHTELHVWRICDELRRRVAAVAGRPGLLRDPWLRNQLVAAAESPCPNIAEGFSRYHPRENGRFVRIAKASLTETIEHLERAASKGYLDSQETEELCVLARRGRGAATKYITYLESATAPHLPRTRPPGKDGKPKDSG